MSNSHLDAFPGFMKHPSNRIHTAGQATPGVEGYVFDGADGSQMTFWTCTQSAAATTHIHDYDEYMIVVQGSYILIIDGKRLPLNPGDEYSSPKEPRIAAKYLPAPGPSTASAAIA